MIARFASSAYSYLLEDDTWCTVQFDTDRTADHAELAAGISDGKPWTTHIAAEL